MLRTIGRLHGENSLGYTSLLYYGGKNAFIRLLIGLCRLDSNVIEGLGFNIDFLEGSVIDMAAIIDEKFGIHSRGARIIAKELLPQLRIELPGLFDYFPEFAAIVEADGWENFVRSLSATLFQPTDLVRLEDWIDDAAGYILEPGVLGSELLDDMISIAFPIFGAFESIHDVALGIKRGTLEFNKYARQYNAWRIAALNILSDKAELVATMLEGLTVRIDDLDELAEYLEGFGMDTDFLYDLTPEIDFTELVDALRLELEYIEDLLELIEFELPPIELLPEEFLPLIPDEWSPDPRHPQNPGRRLLEYFLNPDTNGDGVVSDAERETRNSPMFWNPFGRITVLELEDVDLDDQSLQGLQTPDTSSPDPDSGGTDSGDSWYSPINRPPV